MSRGCRFCEECGAAARVEACLCTYCAAPTDPAARYCEECGGAAAGIACPHCGATSHRNFCPACNSPLTAQAHAAVERVKALPQVRRLAQINSLLETPPDPAAPAPPDREALLREMQALFDALVPDPAEPPEVRRSVACAVKFCVEERTVSRSVSVAKYWVCNLCGCRHGNPAECLQPELGGTWHVEETVTEKVTCTTTEKDIKI